MMEQEVATFAVKKGLAQMLKGGVIMDVVTPEHARIAEDAGAAAVMALERVPADIRAQGGVARMSDPELILHTCWLLLLVALFLFLFTFVAGFADDIQSSSIEPSKR